MALKVGSLYVSLGAETSGLLKGMGEALKSVEKVTAAVRKVSSGVAQTSAALTAMAGAAVHLAATVDGPTKAALDSVKEASTSLAIETSRMLLPAIREVAGWFRTAATWVAGLSPELKQQISHFAVLAVTVGGAAAVFGKIAAIVGPLAGLMGGLLEAVAAVGAGALLEVVVGLGLVVAAVVALHRAWRLNWGGINDIVRTAVQYWQDIFGGAGNFISDVVKKIFDFFKWQILGTIDTLDRLQKAFGLKLFDAEGFKSGVEGLFKDLKSGEFISNAVEFAKDAGAAAKDAFVEEMKKIADELGITDMWNKMTSIAGKRHSGKAAEAPKLDLDGWAPYKPSEAPLSAPPMVQAPDFDQRKFGKYWQDRTAEAVANGKIIDSLGSTIVTSARTLVSNLGDFGTMVNSVIQGAQSGGVAGAVAAAVVELLSRTNAFQQLVKVANGALKKLVQAFEPVAQAIIPPLAKILAVATNMVAPILGALGPVFESIGGFLDGLMPFLVLISMALSVLGPIMQTFGKLLGLFVQILQPIWKLLFFVVQGLVIVVLGVFRGIMEVWNTLVKAVGDIVEEILNLITLGTQKAWVKQVADSIRSLHADTGAIDQQLKLALDIDWDRAANAANRAAEGIGGLDDEVRNVTESLSNVPTGFRVALARYNSTGDANGNPIPVPSGAGQMVITGDVYVNANDVADFERQMRTSNFQLNGNPMAARRAKK